MGSRQQPNYAPLPPAPTYVQLTPGVEQLIALVRESHATQVAMYRQQQEFARDMIVLSNVLEQDVSGRRNRLHGINARLDYLTTVANNLLAVSAQNTWPAESTEGGSEPEINMNVQRPTPLATQASVMLATPDSFDPRSRRPVVHFDAPPVIPSPLASPHTRSRQQQEPSYRPFVE